jgi:hypothetical protein
MTPEEIAFAEEALGLAEANDMLSYQQYQAILTAAKYGVEVANNYRNRSPRFTHLGIGVTSDA